MRTARSVVICCYTEDRWDLLRLSVRSAAAQLAARDELVVVVDHNPQLLQRATEAFSAEATIVPNGQRRGLSGARNTGVATATGEIVTFLDDDAAAEPGWLDRLSAPFAAADVVGAGGAALPTWIDGSGPGWLPAEFHWVVGCSYKGLPTTEAPIRNPIGANMAFRRKAILAAGGFSAELGRIDANPVGGEETDLAIRVRAGQGGRILYVPDAVVHHTVSAERATWGYFVRRCFAEGRSKAILALRVGTMSATDSERAYLGTLWRGCAARLGDSLRRRSVAPLGQAAAIVAGLALTALGFALGMLQHGARRLKIIR